MLINQLVINILNTFQNINVKYATKAASSVFVQTPTRAKRILEKKHTEMQPASQTIVQ